MSNRLLYLACVCSLLGGCSYNNNLLFGDSEDFSLSLHPAPAGGADFNFGYKQMDIAVVPVGAIDSAGRVKQRRASGDEKVDAVSVFAQFSGGKSASNDGHKQNVTFGKFFATGLAAQNLARGVKEGLIAASTGARPIASPQTADSAPLTARPATTVAAPESKLASSIERPDQIQTENRSKPLDPLVFAQYNMVGMNIGASTVSSGADFTIGIASRNVAVMPLFADGKHGPESVGSGANDDKDAFSVVGRFKVGAEIRSQDIGLESFFASGIAAQELSLGLRSQISELAASSKAADSSSSSVDQGANGQESAALSASR